MRKKHLMLYAGALAIVTILLSGAFSPASEKALICQNQPEREFVIAMGEGVQSANPFIGIYDSDYMLYSYIYDYLVYPDEDGSPTPNLAESWWCMDGATATSTGSDADDLLDRDPSSWPLGSIWEYNLTDGVNWSDGETFDADDVVYTVSLQTGHNYQTFWAYQPYTKWIDHAQKVDPYKVRIFFTDRTNGSNPPIPISWGTSLSFPIMPKHAMQKMTSVSIAQNWTGVPAIGTGPFMGTDSLEDEIIAKEKITLVRNPQWELGLGKVYNRTCEIDKLIMKFYAEEQTLILDLKAKILDVSEVTPINYLSLFNATDRPPELKLVSQFSPTVYTKNSHFNFEIIKAPGSLNPARCDPAVHRACALATDRDYIVDEIFKGLGVKGTGILTPVFSEWYYDAWNDHDNMTWFNVTSSTGSVVKSYHEEIAHAMEFNITRANAILNASGYTWPTYPDGYREIGTEAAKRLVAMGKATSIDGAMKDKNGNKRYLSFENIYEQEVFEDLDIAKYLEMAWKKIGVEIIPMIDYYWWDSYYGFQHNFEETYWSGDPDPNYLLYVPSNYSMDGWNEWGTPDPYYDYCYMKQATELNETQRVHWVHECEKYLFLSGAAFLTTCNPKNCYAYIDGRWSNWGDLNEHPGLALDHYWGETPMLLKVKWIPVERNDNTALVLSSILISIVAIAAVTVLIARRRKRARDLQDEDEPEYQD